MVTRLSGTLAKRPTPNAAVNAFYFATTDGKVYESDGNAWTERGILDKRDVVGHFSGLDAAKPPSNQALGWVYHATDTGVQYEAFPTGWHVPSLGITDIPLPALRELINGQFGLRFQSTSDVDAIVVAGGTQDGAYVDLDPTHADSVRGFFELVGGPGTAEGQPFGAIIWQPDEARWKIFDVVGPGGPDDPYLLYYAYSDVARPDLVPDDNTPDGWKNASDGSPASIRVTYERARPGDRASSRILLETIGATRENPYLVQFNQIILDPFTGPGEFYLDESDVGDVGGESTITVATKDGFSAGYTPSIVKAIKGDKIYRINFTPGTTGDGIYLINISAPLQQQAPPAGEMFRPVPRRLPPIHPAH